MRGLVICFGILLPILTLWMEIEAGVCAELFLDPIPTSSHVVLILIIPLACTLGLIVGSRQTVQPFLQRWAWAADQVQQFLDLGNREAAVKLATKYRLVTPVTGAVVLETDEQFEEAGLTPVSTPDERFENQPSESAQGTSLVGQGAEPSLLLMIPFVLVLAAVARYHNYRKLRRVA